MGEACRSRCRGAVCLIVPALVALFLVLAACQAQDASRSACLSEGLQDLSHWRWVEPCLTGGFAWQACERSLPAGHCVPVAECPAAHLALPAVSTFPRSCDQASRKHLTALRLLVLAPDRSEEAVQMLESLSAQDPANALVLSDLAAAYGIRAQRADRPSDLLRSLAAARRATELSGEPGARFNLSFAGELLHLSASLVSIGDESSAHETLDDPGWSTEARQRRKQLRQEAAHPELLAPPLDRQQLDAAVEAGDRAILARLAQRFPDALQRHLEEVMLPEWARSHGEEAARRLAAARAIAAELARHTGDRQLAEVVEVITAASDSQPDAANLEALRLAHLALGRAHLAGRAHEWRVAEYAYGQAGRWFAVVESPLRATADLGVAIARFERPEEVPLSEVLSRLVPLEQEAREHGYHHLLGRVLWIRALCLFFQGRALEALAACNRSLESFERMGDSESEANMRVRKAGILRALGEYELAWRESFQALGSLPRVVESQSRHHLLGEAAAGAFALGHPDVALSYQDRAVHLIEGELDATPRDQKEKTAGLRVNLAIGLRERAALKLHSGRPELARRDLDRAIALAKTPYDDNVRRALEARVREVEGLALMESDPSQAVKALLEARRLSPPDGFRTFKATLAFELARAYRRQGITDQARQSLITGIQELRGEERALLEGRKRGMGEALWKAYFARFQGAYEDLIRLLVEEDRPRLAFAYAERARAFEPLDLVLQLPTTPQAFQRLAAQGEPLRLGEVQRRLPGRTFLIEYKLLDDRLLIWLVWRGGFDFLVRKVGRGTVERWVADLQASAVGRDERGFEAALAAPFADLVGAPLARIAHEPVSTAGEVARLVFVPDGAIHGLPLAALLDPESRRPVLEEHPVSVAPSATLYVFSLLRDRELARGGAPTALLVGDPAFDPGSDLSRGLERSPRALEEVERIRHRYPRATVLTGADATIARFLELTPASTVVHFAGHAIVNSRAPFRSLLLLAPAEGYTGALSAEDLLSELRLDTTRLVVLSACSSAGGHSVGPDGLAALVRPLIAAGVPAVVGSLWDVGDDPTEELLVEFHRHYAGGEDAESALRLAQMHLIEASNKGLSSPLAWAPFQVIGHASSPFPKDTQPSRRGKP